MEREIQMCRVDAWTLPGSYSRKAVAALAKDEFPEQRVLKITPFGFAWLVVLSPHPNWVVVEGKTEPREQETGDIVDLLPDEQEVDR